MKTFLKLPVLAVCAALSLAACKQEAVKNQAASEAEADPAGLGSLNRQVSYAWGLEIGRTLKQIRDQGVEIDLKLLNEALETVLDGKTPKLNEAQERDVMMRFLSEQEQRARAAAAEAGKENLAKGQAFLAENAKKAGVKTTASGLQYTVKKEGGGASPGAGDSVSVEYSGRLIDGTEFDGSRGTPVSFPLEGIIKGWKEGLQLMKEGAEYTFYIPAELAYGELGSGRIPPQSALVFDIKLLKVEKKR